MGFLDKLKKIFVGKKKEVVEISERDIPDWLDNVKKRYKSTLNESVNLFYNKLEETLGGMEEAIDILKKVDISERKIQDRFKVITEVGKKDYVHALEELIRGLGFKNKEDYSLEHIRGELNKFFKVEVKAKLKATQLIGKEIEAINVILSSIKKQINGFLDKNEASILELKEVEKLSIKFNLIREKTSEENYLDKEISKLEEEIEEDKKRIGGVDIEILEIKESPEFIKEKELKSFAEKKNQELAKIDLEIKILVDNSILERELYLEEDKKKARFIREYLSDPINSLMNDENMEIVDYMRKIKKAAESGKITLKKSKLKKTQNCIDSLGIIKSKRGELLKEIGEIGPSDKNTGEIKIRSLEHEKEQKEKDIIHKTDIIEKIKKKKKNLMGNIGEMRKKFGENLKKNEGVDMGWKAT